MKKRVVAFVKLVRFVSDEIGITCFFKMKHTFDPIEVQAHDMDATKCKLCHIKLSKVPDSDEHKALLLNQTLFEVAKLAAQRKEKIKKVETAGDGFPSHDDVCDC